MQLDDYYFIDPRVILIPIEHLTPDGVPRAFAAVLHARAGWAGDRITLFNRAFTLYWQRSVALAGRTGTWPPPRLRHVAVVTQPDAVRPYVQLLNTSAWLLYASDLDPHRSNPEFVAYLLAHGDRLALTGEVTGAALHNAAYWFDRTDSECAAFAAAAEASSRPDAEAYRALARALPWLRQLAHDTLRPPRLAGGYRSIPHTGLLVRRDREHLPPGLANEWKHLAERTLRHYYAIWQPSDQHALQQLTDWLAHHAPPLIVTAGDQRIVWSSEPPERVGGLRTALRSASGAAVRDVLADLQAVAARTHSFMDSVLDPGQLPAPDPATEQRGYVYLHRERRQIAYNLYEAGIERLQGPALPYARSMLGARTIHEWAHLAVDAGWVPQTTSPPRAAALTAALAEELADAVAAAPRVIAEATRADVQALTAAHGARPGVALARLLLSRVPDYQANVLAQRYLTLPERETYVRQNIRSLRHEYALERRWRMLVRYLYEYQYLRFSAVPDRKSFFLRSTWFDADFFATGILDEARFERLAAAVAAICETYAVDESRFRPLPIAEPQGRPWVPGPAQKIH
jgi:hypothetical protein